MRNLKLIITLGAVYTINLMPSDTCLMDIREQKIRIQFGLNDSIADDQNTLSQLIKAAPYNPELRKSLMTYIAELAPHYAQKGLIDQPNLVNNQTALHLSTLNALPNVFALLLAHGANPNLEWTHTSNPRTVKDYLEYSARTISAHAIDFRMAGEMLKILKKHERAALKKSSRLQKK